MPYRAPRTGRSFSLAVFAVITTAGTAASQELQVGVHAGAAIPVGQFYTMPVELNSGTAVGVVLNLNSTKRPYGIAVALDYSSMRSQSDSIGYVESWAIAGSFVWWPGQLGSRVRPYLMAGAGADYWAIRPVNGIAVGLDAGAGATVQLGASWLPYIESRYHVTLTDGSNLQQVLVVAGVRYRL